MDASVTFRFPPIAVSGEQGRVADESQARAEGSPQPVSDDALLSQVCQGSREALSQLFARYARLVRTIAHRIVRDASEAEDILQDVFLFIYRKASGFDPAKSSARSWIVQMTYHRAIDRRRYLQSRRFYTNLDLNGAIEVRDPHSETADIAELSHMVGTTTIQGLLDALTADQRNTLTLHFFEGYTFDEIAASLGQSVGNIRNHYYRGLEKLRKQFFPGKLPGRNGCGRK